MTYKFREYHIPERMMGGIKRYVENHVKPGAFLTAIIRNDLRDACALADDENIGNLPAYVAYFYNEAPAQCWGSLEAMAAWLAFGTETEAQDGSILSLMQNIKTAADGIMGMGDKVPGAKS